MERRHEQDLMRRIDEVAWAGVSHIRWWELKAWYDKDRVGKTVWRDLKSRFDETADDSSAQLYIYEGVEGITLIHSDGLKRIDDKVGEAD
jgi:hypothetical protein